MRRKAAEVRCRAGVTLLCSAPRIGDKGWMGSDESRQVTNTANRITMCLADLRSLQTSIQFVLGKSGRVEECSGKSYLRVIRNFDLLEDLSQNRSGVRTMWTQQP